MDTPHLEPATEYARRRDLCRAELVRLDRRGLLLANARLLTFAAAAVLFLLVVFHKLPIGWLVAALASFAAFVAVAVAHDRVIQEEKRTKELLAINERGLMRLDGRWQELPSLGARHLTREHPYAADLNIFGRASLFQLLDTTGTKLGEERLAALLSAPSPVEEIPARQQSVAELSPMLDFRQALEAEGRLASVEKADPAKLLAWAESAPLLSKKPVYRVLSFVLPLVLLAAYVAGELGALPSRTWVAVLLLNVVVWGSAREITSTVFEKVSAPGERFVRFDRLFGLIETTPFRSGPLAAARSRLESTGAAPSLEMKRLGRAINFFQARHQPLFHFLFNAFLLWDFHCIHALESWQARCGTRARAWFEALAELEALSSFAGLLHDNPAFTFPAVQEKGPRVVAKGLGHPLIPGDRRVVNDVALEGPGQALLITGSNMSGKTTFLRTLGVNAVLGLAGSAVCAKELSLGRLEIVTSMRVEDSLAQGLSYFYAELKRLKTVVDACDGRRPTLFLLDEILLGTNTAERQLASRAILKQLVERGASGGVTTHDMALTTLEEETGGRIRNVHFTDTVRDGQMTFDYVMRPGVVTTTNALELLRLAGIEVDLAAAAR